MRTDESQQRTAFVQGKTTLRKKAKTKRAACILDLLLREHTVIKKLLRDFETCPNGASLKELRDRSREIDSLLRTHADCEMRTFYQVMGKKAEAQQLVLEALEEHKIVIELLDEIAATRASENLRAKMRVLRELTMHHIKEEETELFDCARALLTESERKRIGLKFQQLRDRYSLLH